MECADFQMIVAGEREDDLSPAESAAFEEHLEACESCRESVLRAEEDLDRLALLAEPPVLANAAWARVDEAVRAETKKKPGREDPFAVIVTVTASSAEVVPPISMPEPKPLVPADPRSALERGRKSRIGLVLACAASLLVAIFLGIFALPGSRPRPVEPSIGRVKPFEPGEVRLQEQVVYGPGYKGIENGSFVWVFPLGIDFSDSENK